MARPIPFKNRPRGIWLLVLAFWLALIFGSSSTVVTPRRFYSWIEAHVLTSEDTFRKFTLFWGLGWFAIVKGWHLTEYAILFLFSKAALDRFPTARGSQNRALALVFCVLFAASDEYHQSFVAGRNGTWIDVAIDSLGAGLAALISTYRERRKVAR